MFKDVKELKEFIIWCKSQKVKSMKVDGVTFELSEISFIDDLQQPSEPIQSNSDVESFQASQEDLDEDQLLYHSAT